MMAFYQKFEKKEKTNLLVLMGSRPHSHLAAGKIYEKC
jgi:hypothetical protein